MDPVQAGLPLARLSDPQARGFSAPRKQTCRSPLARGHEETSGIEDAPHGKRGSKSFVLTNGLRPAERMARADVPNTSSRSCVASPPEENRNGSTAVSNGCERAGLVTWETHSGSGNVSSKGPQHRSIKEQEVRVLPSCESKSFDQRLSSRRCQASGHLVQETELPSWPWADEGGFAETPSAFAKLSSGEGGSPSCHSSECSGLSEEAAPLKRWRPSLHWSNSDRTYARKYSQISWFASRMKWVDSEEVAATQVGDENLGKQACLVSPNSDANENSDYWSENLKACPSVQSPADVALHVTSGNKVKARGVGWTSEKNSLMQIVSVPLAANKFHSTPSRQLNVTSSRNRICRSSFPHASVWNIARHQICLPPYGNAAIKTSPASGIPLPAASLHPHLKLHHSPRTGSPVLKAVKTKYPVTLRFDPIEQSLHADERKWRSLLKDVLTGKHSSGNPAHIKSH